MKIHYLTGSRADFGLMLKCLQAIDAAPEHELGIVVTGQHTTEKYGQSLNDIVESGLPIVGEIPVALSGEDGSEMALALADELAGLTRLWQENRPDMVLLLGDRGEMVAGALASVHLGIHIGHIHGGERTGTLDESFRHAISKLSHIHYPATEESRTRLIRMGEDPAAITTIGAPGLIGITENVASQAEQIRVRFDLPQNRPLALCVFHPVVQEALDAATQIQAVVEATSEQGYALIIMRPNSDAGGLAIDHYLDSLIGRDDLVILDHLPRPEYLNVLASADLLIGNSSSGIIESASFQTRCVNIGDRQNDRQRNANTVDCHSSTPVEISKAIKQAQEMTFEPHNVYGDGMAHLHLLADLNNRDLTPDYLLKRNSY